MFLVACICKRFLCIFWQHLGELLGQKHMYMWFEHVLVSTEILPCPAIRQKMHRKFMETVAKTHVINWH